MKAIRFVCLALSSIVFNLSAVCQDVKEQQLLREISDLDAEIERLRAALESTETMDTLCYNKTLYTELQPMSDEQFEQFCVQELAKLDSLPVNVEDHVISSCRKTRNEVTANFCVFRNPKAEVAVNTQPNLSKEEELKKIQNTIKMYQDIVAALNKDLAANGIGSVDDAGNLVMKHLNLKELEWMRPIIQKGKDWIVEKLRDYAGVSDVPPIENKNAEAVDEIINTTENIASVVPGADKLTLHYLWRIFKSVPDAGKIIGTMGASVNIYFQRKEAIQNLHKYEERKKELEAQP